MSSNKITWTKTDEAPTLASYSLLPILRAYFKGTGVEVEAADISLAGRIIANFPDRLRDDQKIPDELSRLGKLAQTPDANIIKLPNISASIPQLRAAIAELRAKGYDIPDYPEAPSTESRNSMRSANAWFARAAPNQNSCRCCSTATSVPGGASIKRVPLRFSSIARLRSAVL